MSDHTEIAIDGNLVDGQAMAVLALLSERGHCFDDVPEEAAILVRTSAWYNGRERGVCICTQKLTKDGRESLIITFGEHRSSDNIFVDCWISDRIGMNPPTHDELTQEAYDRRRAFDYGACGEVERYIVTLMKEYLQDDMIPLSWVCPKCKREGDSPVDLLGGDCCPKCFDRPKVEMTGRVLVPCSADPRTW